MQSTSGISKAQWRKDAPSLLLALCAVAFLPLSIFLLRPRPLAADTSGELITLAREQTAEESLTILSQHEAAWNPESPETRWKEIEQKLYESDDDLETQEVNGVLSTAKSSLAKSGWPLYARRAFLNDQQVWLVAVGRGFGHPNYICPPSLSELHRDELDSAKSGMTITVISAQSPYHVLTH